MNDSPIDLFPLMLIRTAGLPLQWPAASGTELPALEKSWRSASAEYQQAVLDAAAAFEREKDVLVPDPQLQKVLTNTRRALRNYRNDALLIIDPYLLENRPDLGTLLEAIEAKNLHQLFVFKQLQESFDLLISAEKHALMQYCSDDTLRRSLLFSSHSLLEALPSLQQTPPANWAKKERQTAAALLKYVSRASSKTTPLSRLATLSLQSLHAGAAEQTDDFFNAPKHAVTPNVALLPALYDVLLRERAFFNTLPLRLNPALSIGASGYAWLYYDGEQESFQSLDARKALEILCSVFQEQGGALRFCDLISALEAAIDDDREALESFVFQLTDHGFLEWVWPEKGLAPSWCSGLYNYLGFLPAAPMLTDAAYLLQWLRTAARSLAFQPIVLACELQEEALTQCRTFFERYQGQCPDIAPEQIFYEDVETRTRVDLPAAAVQHIVADVQTALSKTTSFRLNGLAAHVQIFGRAQLAIGASLPFLSFCRLFLETKHSPAAEEVVEVSPDGKTIGALLQFYQSGAGEYRAVLNALFPGGGKMMARWLHLFPVSLREQLQDWWPAETLSFPWQDWSNANFQPHVASESLAMPGGRVGAGATLELRDLLVYRENDHLQLRDKQGRRIVFSDLGLEDPASRPPVMQILGHLGTPLLTAALFGSAPWAQVAEGVRMQERLEYQSLVLQRQGWQITPEAWAHVDRTNDLAHFRTLREQLSAWGVPRFFFAAYSREQARYFDQDSPLMLLEFAKMIRKRCEVVYLSEMLPTPDTWLAEVEGSKRAAEWVLEWKQAR